jgi:hypothetical protein
MTKDVTVRFTVSDDTKPEDLVWLLRINMDQDNKLYPEDVPVKIIDVNLQ